MTERPQKPMPPTYWQITLQPFGQQFSALPTDTVLLAALQAGVDWPNSCRNGTCRTCMAQVLQGQVQHLIEWPGLSAEEKSEGYFLPCVACAQSDLTVQAP